MPRGRARARDPNFAHAEFQRLSIRRYGCSADSECSEGPSVKGSSVIQGRFAYSTAPAKFSNLSLPGRCIIRRDDGLALAGQRERTEPPPPGYLATRPSDRTLPISRYAWIAVKAAKQGNGACFTGSDHRRCQIRQHLQVARTLLMRVCQKRYIGHRLPQPNRTS